MLAIVLVPPAASGQESGSISIALADADAHATDDPRSAHYVVDAAAPGNTFEREVLLTNTTPNEVPIDLYVGDASIRDRRFSFEDAPLTGGIASWSSVAPSTLVLAAGATSTAVVTIDPPRDADRGEHYGVIWAQVGSTSGATTVINRVGVRVYLALGDGTSPPSDLTVDLLTASRDADGAALVAVNVTNTGERALEISGDVALEEPSGEIVSTPIEPGTVLPPRDSGEALARVPDVADGPWDATVTVLANGIERQVTATISFPHEPDRRARPVVVTPSGTGESPPMAMVILAVVLLAFLLAAFARVRARRRAPEL